MGILQRVSFKKELLLSQKQSRSELEARQFQRLKAMLSHAYENVPFYQGRFKKAGLDLDSIRSLSDLNRVPIISKDDIRSTPAEQMVARGANIGSLGKISTSGTTGQPLVVLFDQTTVAWRQACSDRTSDAVGLDAWDHDVLLYFTSSKVDEEPFIQRKMKSWALKRKQLYARPFYFTYKCDEILEDLIRFEPKVIEAQPAYLRELKSALTRSGKSLKLKMLVSSGDILDSSTRKELESYFSCPIYERTGLGTWVLWRGSASRGRDTT